MQQPETKYVVRADGASIAYQTWGDGPTDLLYSPGFVSHLDLFWGDPGYTRFFERLGSIARVIAFDKLGTGCSDQISHVPSLEERMEDIRLVLDAAGSERAVLMGFSEGGPSCALLAASAPERVSSLILYGSFARGPGTDLPPELLARWWAKKALLDEMIAEWGSGRSVEFFAPSAVGRFQRRVAAVFERAAASPGMMAGLVKVIEQTDVRAILPSIRVPTLVLHRSGDTVPVEAGRELAELIPGARFVELPGTDHAFWFGDFASIAEEIEAFVVGGHPSAPVERGLATLLFTDVVDSTRLASSLGDSEWRALLERHDTIVRNAVERRNGRLVKSMGDGALATFGSPANAVRCGIELSEALGPIGLPIRAGVHTGECELIGDDVGGLAVHIGARVGAKAGAGEVLVSSTVAELVMGSGLDFEERGTHELKGVPGRWRLMAVAGEGQPRQVVEHEVPARPGDRAFARIALRFPGMIRATTRVSGRRG
ncbi:MAG: adenylate/guanylate cyclase domain-containing protein [Solirubrobacterales bacterium]